MPNQQETKTILFASLWSWELLPFLYIYIYANINSRAYWKLSLFYGISHSKWASAESWHDFPYNFKKPWIIMLEFYFLDISNNKTKISVSQLWWFLGFHRRVFFIKWGLRIHPYSNVPLSWWFSYYCWY